MQFKPAHYILDNIHTCSLEFRKFSMICDTLRNLKFLLLSNVLYYNTLVWCWRCLSRRMTSDTAKLDDEPRWWSRIYDDVSRAQGKAWLGNVKQGKAKQGKAKQGNARQGNARQGNTRQVKTSQRKAGQGMARQGKARQGKARQRWTQEEEEIAGILFRWLLVGQFFPALRNVNFVASVPVVRRTRDGDTLSTRDFLFVNRSKGMTVTQLPVSGAQFLVKNVRNYNTIKLYIYQLFARLWLYRRSKWLI